MTNFQPFSTRLTFANINAAVNAQGVPLGATLSNPYNNYPGGTPFPYKGDICRGRRTLCGRTGFRMAANVSDEYLDTA